MNNRLVLIVVLFVAMSAANASGWWPFSDSAATAAPVNMTGEINSFSTSELQALVQGTDKESVAMVLAISNALSQSSFEVQIGLKNVNGHVEIAFESTGKDAVSDTAVKLHYGPMSIPEVLKMIVKAKAQVEAQMEQIKQKMVQEAKIEKVKVDESLTEKK